MIALVEMEKMGKIGKMGEVSTAGIPIGVRIAAATTMPAMDSIAAAASATPKGPPSYRVGDADARGDHGHRQHRGLQGDGQAGDDIGGVAVTGHGDEGADHGQRQREEDHHRHHTGTNMA
jgi:hypothetical protein